MLMKKISTLLISAFFICACTSAQSWSALGGTNGLNANSSVLSVCADQAGNVYAAGSFTNSNGHQYVAKWDGTSWSELGGFDALAANDWIYSLSADPSGNVYAGGLFSDTLGKRYVAMWNGSNWMELGGVGTLGANGLIYSVCTNYTGGVFAAGAFTNANGNYYVALYDGTNWTELGGVDSLGANMPITTICADWAGNVYAAGYFTNTNGKHFVARYHGNNWNELAGLDADSVILSIGTDPSGNNLYAGGMFTDSGGAMYVARWDWNSWSVLGGPNALAANGWIESLCADFYGNVYAAGNFTNSSGMRYVAKWDGNSWIELGGNNSLGANSNISVLSLDSAGNNVFAAGSFTNFGGSINVARFNQAVPTCSAYFTIYPDTVPHNWIAVNLATGSPPLTCYWNWGDSTSSIGLTPTHTYSSPGYYSICLTITDSAGCSSTYCDSSAYIYRAESNSSVITINVVMGGTTGILEQTWHALNVAPNPFSSSINLQGTTANGRLSITDIAGRELIDQKTSESSTVIPASFLPSGFYLLHYMEGNKNVTFKLAKVQ